MKVCYFGTYERDYPRNAIVVAALDRAGFEVVECHEPVWERRRDKAGLHAGLAAVRTLLTLLAAHARLAVRYLRVPAHDVVFVGYVGHFDVPLAFLLSRIRGVPLYFDPLVSLFDTFSGDRALVRAASIKGLLLRWLDRLACAAADVVLVDTRAHLEYFRRTLGVPEAKLRVLPVGADDRVFRPSSGPPRPESPVEVLFVGKLSPLHGCETILRAAARLRGEAFRFTIVGTGQEAERVRRLVGELALDEVRLVDWVAYEDLPGLYARADVCLGIFGLSEKASRVVPNKVYQALAAQRCVLTADTPALREELEPWAEVGVCPPGDPDALAEALRRLAGDRPLRERLASEGRRAFEQRFAIEPLSRVVAAHVADAVPGLAPDDRMEWGTQPEFFGPRHRNREDYLARFLRRHSPGRRVLDAACGSGTLARRLAGEGWSPTALDLSPWFAHAATDRFTAGPVERLQADVTRLPIRTGTFHAAVAGEVLEHLEDDGAAVRELFRVLDERGVLVVSVPADPRKWERLDTWAGHRRRYGVADLGALLESAGFEVLEARHIGFPFVRLYHRFVYLPYLRRTRIRGGRDGSLGAKGRWTRLAGDALFLLFQADRLFDRLPWGDTLAVAARKPPSGTTGKPTADARHAR